MVHYQPKGKSLQFHVDGSIRYPAVKVPCAKYGDEGGGGEGGGSSDYCLLGEELRVVTGIVM